MPPRRHHAFTLIEMLAVIGIMALMAGVLGLALREGNPAVALASAQGTVAGLLAAARDQAVLSQNRAMLVVDADPADERFLRGIHVAVETERDSGQWRITGDDALLPSGIFFVPGTEGVSGATFAPGDGSAGAWPVGRRSSVEVAPPGRILPSAENQSGKYLGMTAPLAASDAAGAVGGGKLVLAAARRTSAGVIFDRPELVRGVALSSYGMAILINDGPGFDF
jgi:prepilin-type N-terminal cleavage/methylation domain-containing protein